MWLDPGKFKPIFEFYSIPESNMQKLEVGGLLSRWVQKSVAKFTFNVSRTMKMPSAVRT